MRTFKHLTAEEIYSNYEYKITKNVIKSEFKWIIDLKVDEKSLNEYSIIFLIAVIDPVKFNEEYGFLLTKWAYLGLKHGDYDSIFLSSIFEMTHSEGDEIRENINMTIKGVSRSKAIPEELKLPKEREFNVYSFLIPHGIKIPENFYSKPLF